MKFILDAKIAFCGNLPNVLLFFLNEESKKLKALLKPFSFGKFNFSQELVAYVNNYVDFCV